MSTKGETYLGDAVYASFDGWMIKLQANDHEQTIYLEPQVYAALMHYARECWPTINCTNPDAP